MIPNNYCTVQGSTTTTTSSVSSAAQSSSLMNTLILLPSSQTTTTLPIMSVGTQSSSSQGMMMSTGNSVQRIDNTVSTMGCYANNGRWTTERSDCDPDQNKHLQNLMYGQSNSSSYPSFEGNPTSFTKPSSGTTSSTSGESGGVESVRQEIEEDKLNEELQAHFEEKFQLQEKLNNATAELLNSATNALQRLQNIPQENLPVETASYISSTNDWLLSLINDLFTSELSMEEVQNKAGELKGRLQDAMQTVAEAMPVIERKPESIIEKMDRLLATIPTIFSFVQEEGVELSAEVADEFQTAASLYSDIKPRCLEDANECLNLQEVLSHLETMRNALTDSLDQHGKSDLKSRIDEMLR
jgi:hypothetical protein